MEEKEGENNNANCKVMVQTCGPEKEGFLQEDKFRLRRGSALPLDLMEPLPSWTSKCPPIRSNGASNIMDFEVFSH